MTVLLDVSALTIDESDAQQRLRRVTRELAELDPAALHRHGPAIASLDPSTGTLTGLRRSMATLRVTVNGVTQDATIRVG